MVTKRQRWPRGGTIFLPYCLLISAVLSSPLLSSLLLSDPLLSFLFSSLNSPLTLSYLFLFFFSFLFPFFGKKSLSQILFIVSQFSMMSINYKKRNTGRPYKTCMSGWILFMDCGFLTLI